MPLVPDIQCKYCERVLAIVSPDGLILPSSEDTIQMCDQCKPFRAKYEAMLTADAHYASFSEYAREYFPKVQAIKKLRKTHMDLANWLIKFDPPLPSKRKQLSESTKRSQSKSVQGHVLTPNLDASGSNSITPFPERKRINFAETTNFRAHYRSSQQYRRHAVEYEEGEHAAPVGTEYLDTSGSTETFMQSSGSEENESYYTDVWEEDSDEETRKEKERLKRILKPIETRRATTETVEESRDSSIQRDARLERLARQTIRERDADLLTAIDREELRRGAREANKGTGTQIHSSKVASEPLRKHHLGGRRVIGYGIGAKVEDEERSDSDSDNTLDVDPLKRRKSMISVPPDQKAGVAEGNITASGRANYRFGDPSTLKFHKK